MKMSGKIGHVLRTKRSGIGEDRDGFVDPGSFLEDVGKVRHLHLQLPPYKRESQQQIFTPVTSLTEGGESRWAKFPHHCKIGQNLGWLSLAETCALSSALLLVCYCFIE